MPIASPQTKKDAQGWARYRVWWGPVALMAAIFLASGGNPARPPGLDFVSADKLIHFLVFGLLATAFYRALASPQPTLRSILAIGLTAAFGAFDEFRQSFTPGRFVEFDDWLADFAGAIVAVLVYRWWHAYRHLLEWKIPRAISPEQAEAGDTSNLCPKA